MPTRPFSLTAKVGELIVDPTAITNPPHAINHHRFRRDFRTRRRHQAMLPINHHGCRQREFGGMTASRFVREIGVHMHQRHLHPCLSKVRADPLDFWRIPIRHRTISRQKNHHRHLARTCLASKRPHLAASDRSHPQISIHRHRLHHALRPQTSARAKCRHKQSRRPSAQQMAK